MKLKKIVAGLLCSVLVLTNAVPAAACTSIYIGGDETANGSSYIGRSEDMGGGIPLLKYLVFLKPRIIQRIITLQMPMDFLCLIVDMHTVILM